MKQNFKKLAINRETIRDLNSPDLLRIRGGEDTPGFTNRKTCTGGHTTRDPDEPI